SGSKLVSNLLVQGNDIFQPFWIQRAATRRLRDFFHTSAYARQILIGDIRVGENYSQAAVFVSADDIGLKILICIESHEVDRDPLRPGYPQHFLIRTIFFRSEEAVPVHEVLV